MSKVMEAIFENGVFRPLQKVDAKEHEKVEIKIFYHDEWQSRFNRIIIKIQKKASQYKAEKIVSDITEAIREVRESERGR